MAVVLKPTVRYRFGVVVVAALSFVPLANALLVLAVILPSLNCSFTLVVAALVGFIFRIVVGIRLKIVALNAYDGFVKSHTLIDDGMSNATPFLHHTLRRVPTLVNGLVVVVRLLIFAKFIRLKVTSGGLRTLLTTTLQVFNRTTLSAPRNGSPS